MKKFICRFPSYGFTILVSVIIIYCTLVPSPLPPDIPRLFPQADKIVHAVMFWAFYTAFALDRTRWQLREGLSQNLSRDWLSVIMVSTLAFGAAIEVAQWLMGFGRGGDILDFAADVAGTVIASFTFRPISKRLLR